VAAAIAGEELDLHARHVDAGRALALAGLARDAQIQRAFDRFFPLIAQLTRKRQAKRVGAAARQMNLVAGDAK